MQGVAEPQQIDCAVKTNIKEEKTKDLKDKETKHINKETKTKKVTKKTEKIVKSATIKPKPIDRTTYDSFFWFNCEVNF